MSHLEKILLFNCKKGCNFKLFSEIPDISKITLNLRPFKSFQWVFWHNLNNLNMLEGIIKETQRISVFEYNNCNISE
jgi:hypothetical protein